MIGRSIGLGRSSSRRKATGLSGSLFLGEAGEKREPGPNGSAVEQKAVHVGEECYSRTPRPMRET